MALIETLVPVEITDDWSAQDRDGNVWYLGGAVRNYEKGKLVDRSGSFEAGVDGAQPRIAMPAAPRPGLTYRQEYLKGGGGGQGRRHHSRQGAGAGAGALRPFRRGSGDDA